MVRRQPIIAAKSAKICGEERPASNACLAIWKLFAPPGGFARSSSASSSNLVRPETQLKRASRASGQSAAAGDRSITKQCRLTESL
eukprot:4284700-Amphidinium_carterae.1